ncbi:ABC transporter substrate-binding protein [Streptomyces sp. NBC_00459]|uniref:ABC transporter substrate-binding protein n=1 Tax=Streptomyces sp. NBC_00459 TaxID=2975749 RepID=UPI002E186EF7
MTLSRRQALATAAAAGTGLGITSFGASASATPSRPRTSRAGAAGREETRTLDELYQAALAEGAKLVIYAGGDTPTQQDLTKSAFLSRFPGIELKLIVDYSKFHDVRVDNQFATGTLVPDLVQLQTVQDFVRWKKQGRLMPYKPAGFSRIHEAFKDPGGAWVAIQVFAFSFMYNVADVGANAPKTPQDLIDPRWKGKIASSYPHDDDAVLYLYRLYTQAYGWDWVAALAEQDVQFARGSHTPGLAVGNGSKAIGIGGAGSLTLPPAAPTRWVVNGNHPFMAWGQRAAILDGAKNPTAAKLYLNWQLSVARQQASFNGWSVRTDVTPAGGLEPIWNYPTAFVDGFPRFMADRAAVERWKQTFALYFGEVKGDPTPGWLGLRPGA